MTTVVIPQLMRTRCDHGLSDRDLVVIMTAAHNIIDQMTKNGERVNPHYNDVWVWFSKHGQGCRDQALTKVTAGLLKKISMMILGILAKCECYILLSYQFTSL